jgi:hypothetical protein
MVESELGHVNQTTNGWKHNKVLKKNFEKKVSSLKKIVFHENTRR